MRYEYLVGQVIHRFPELAHLANWPGDDEGPYVIFGSYMPKFMTTARVLDDASMKQAVMGFVEEMAVSSDLSVVELAGSELIPQLLQNAVLFPAYWPFAGEHTKHLMRWLAPTLAPELDLS